MIGDGGETPSRCELLNMVKNHSNLLGKTIVDDDQDASDAAMDSQFWHDVFQLYFVRGKESRGTPFGDMIFIVRKMIGLHPFFFGRWTSKTEKIVGDISADVDWSRSFYSTLIAHTSYTITVAICSQQEIRNHQAGQDAQLSPIYKVVKTVYAYPKRITYHLDAKKDVETSPACPGIYFVVEDFDSTFDAMVLSSTDHCYCVLLNAHDGAAFPSVDKPTDGSSSSVAPSGVEANPGNSSRNKITLFSGFVSYQMVHEAYNAGKSQLGNFFSLEHSLRKMDRLFMKGPRGRGELEVAVSGVVDQSHEDAGPFSPVDISKRGFGIGSVFRKAANVAFVAAKHAYAVASATSNHEDEMIPIRCCLMSISLPLEHLAYDLLFKGNTLLTI